MRFGGLCGSAAAAVCVWAGAAANARAQEPEPWRVFFAHGARAAALAGVQTNAGFAVVNADGRPMGWVYRTDRIEPAVKGKKGEIGLLVGLSPERTILGVAVVEQREDKKWFDRIKDAFYAQFRGRSLEEAFDNVDAVTGATVSSTAMIKDVFLSGREFAKMVDGR